MQTSFISEHTAELILVPQLINILSIKYPEITPIYYWASREGGIMSRESFQNKQTKLLALYPRRPKVNHPGSRKVCIKINNLLFERTETLNSFGIPVIAGVPLADKLEDIQIHAPCMWLEISSKGSEEILEIDLADNILLSSYCRSIQQDTILQFIDRAAIFTWKEALEKIKELGKSSSRFFNWMSGDLYKPVYLLIQLN